MPVLLSLFVFLCAVGCSESPGTDRLADVTTPPSVSEPDAATDGSPTAHLLARAARLELATEYVPPPGDPLEHQTAGFAKTLCSAVFVTGLAPAFAAEHVGFFTGPYEQRRHVRKRQVDRADKRVSLTLENGVVRTAVYLGDQGCVALPKGVDAAFFEPVDIMSALADPRDIPWPMGDVLSVDKPPAGIDVDKLAAAVEAIFEPAAETAAFVVTYRDRIIAERYGDGIDLHTPLESWSMGKSLTAALLGVLIRDGTYHLWQPAPIPEWQTTGDPRQTIRIADILRMSSGIRCPSPWEPGSEAYTHYVDHYYLYTGGIDAFHWAATRPPQWPPNMVGRYRNCDPVLINYLIRLAVERRGDVYHQFPQQALFDKLGIRDMVLETDPYGNFLLQGYELGSARDWARLGILFLNDGVWQGERLLPEEFVEFVRTPAPAWIADGRPYYGGLFWFPGAFADDIRALAEAQVPGTYIMAGAGGQFTIIIPSKALVIVRLGHYRGQTHFFDSGTRPGAGSRMIRLLFDAVPDASRD